MAKRKAIPNVWAEETHTGASAVAAATGAPMPVVRKGRASPSAEREQYAVTTFRLRKDQWDALRDAAHARAKKLGGKADASAVLREILYRWTTKGDK